MNRQEHLLTCLSEECAEVAQRVSKALRFGLDDVQRDQPLSNRVRIRDELKDLLAVVNILCEEGTLSPSCMPSQAEVDQKRAKIERYMEISRREGVLS